MNKPTTKAVFKFAVRVKRANVVFAPGFDPGVLSTQEISFTVPEQYSPALLAARLREEARLMIDDVIEVDIVPISVPEPKP